MTGWCVITATKTDLRSSGGHFANFLSSVISISQKSSISRPFCMSYTSTCLVPRKTVSFSSAPPNSPIHPQTYNREVCKLMNLPVPSTPMPEFGFFYGLLPPAGAPTIYPSKNKPPAPPAASVANSPPTNHRRQRTVLATPSPTRPQQATSLAQWLGCHRWVSSAAGRPAGWQSQYPAVIAR
jgi:hypothetical protein